jgi:hypothetical protein
MNDEQITSEYMEAFAAVTLELRKTLNQARGSAGRFGGGSVQGFKSTVSGEPIAFLAFAWGNAAREFNAKFDEAKEGMEERKPGAKTTLLTTSEQFQSLNILDLVRDCIMGAGKEEFTKTDLLLLIDNVKSREQLFDPDVVLAQEIATQTN